MKTKQIHFIFCLLPFLFFASCFNQKPKPELTTKKEVNVNDTTEILKIPFKGSSSKVEYEIEVKKGTKIMHGIKKRFYNHGSVYSEGNYKDGKKNGIKYTYYQAYGGDKPKVWKEQSYKDGKLDGVCKRYHKNEKLQAEYSYKKGLLSTGLKEWNKSGAEMHFPKLVLSKEVVNHQTYITARMSNNTKNVKYYSGVLVEGKYVSKNMLPLLTKDGVGELTIPHTSTQESVTITAELVSRYRNKYYVAKTLKLR